MSPTKKNKDAFFIKKISQSEYRSPDKKEKSPERKAVQYLNLTLSKLKPPTKKQNKELVELILEENKRLLDLLLPEEKHDSVNQSMYLNDIFKRLGLTHE